jgi:DNA/RNA endonuclease YhcR with UshA esterase domain
VTRINENVTVEMLVKAAKNFQHCLHVFLASEADHRDPTNLAVAITKSAKARLAEVTIDDPASYVKGKVIRVTGTVSLRENRPEIEVDNPDQITVV